MKREDTILVVDDMEVNRAVLCSIFENKCNVLEAENGRQAMEILEKNPAVNVILLDIVMPEMDGYQVLQKMNESGTIDKIPVVVITAEISPEIELLAFDLGARDIISKPFEPFIVKRRVENIIELYRHRLHLEELVRDQAYKLKESNEIIIDALSSVIESRSLESGQHIFRIRMFTKILLKEIAKTNSGYDLNEHTIELIASASSMHDIGKIAIPDSILNKPGRLTADEFEIMKTHTTTGCKILKSLNKMSDREYLLYAYNICRYHHERYDGKGYPDGLKGDNIPICAQAVSVADAYDALTTDRVYKSAYPHQKAMDMILGGECGTFNPQILQCLKKVSEQFRQLAKNYADGSFIYPHTEEGDSGAQIASFSFSKEELSHIELYSVLRYLGHTAIEFDLNTEYFNILYAPEDSLAIFKDKGGHTQRSEFMNDFISHYVHPEDIDSVMGFISARYEDFFEEVQSQPYHEFRALDPQTQRCASYRATFLPLRTDIPQNRKAIVILENSAPPAPLSSNMSTHASDSNEAHVMETLHESYTMTAVIDLTKDSFMVLHTNEQDPYTHYAAVSYSGICEELLQNRVHPDDRSYFEENFSLENMRRFFTAETKKSVVYRFLGRNGKYHWRENMLVKNNSFSGGDTLVYSLVKYADQNEIDRIKAARRDVIFGREIYPVLLDKFCDILFEYDLKNGTTYYSHGFEEKFGFRAPNNMRELYNAARTHISKEDIDEYIACLKNLDEPPDIRDIEYRYRNAKGDYIWCRKRFLITRDESGFAIRVNGIMTDVDRYKRENALLRQKSETDQLTGLYNKMTVQDRIQAYLSECPADTMHALFILDIDNFKIVNDIYGHLTGDKTLEKISDRITSVFEDNSIVGRVGGDEFIIFIKEVPSSGYAHDKAQLLLNRLNEILSSFNNTASISVSIGISFYPQDGTAFYDLFTRADLALYEAKRLGKSQWRVYNESMNTNASLLKSSPEHLRAEHSFTDSFKIQLLQNFYACETPEEGIRFIFDATARYCGLSHILIYETYSGAKKLYDWSASSILNHTSYPGGPLSEDIRRELLGLASENGLLCIEDADGLSSAGLRKYLKEAQSAALLIAGVADSKTEYGFVAFVEHEAARQWSKHEKDIISFVAKTAALVYLKTRYLQDLEEKYTLSNLYFNQINIAGYVIDETFKIMEANRFLREKMMIETGEKCYRLFQNRDKPCEGCPVLKLNKSCNTATSPIYRKKYDEEVTVTAAKCKTGRRAVSYLVTVGKKYKISF